MKFLDKYTNFITEKLILEHLLLESNVVYSDKFRKVLLKMPENKTAKDLLEIENKDLDVISNYFDINIDNDNVLTFTPDRVAQQVLNDAKEYVTYIGARGGWLTNNIEANGDIFAQLGFEPKTEKVFHPNHTDVGEIISRVVSEKSGKTWCYVKFPTGEGVYNLEKLKPYQQDFKKIIFNKNRQEVRIGRAVRLLLNANNITFSAAEIEIFVNKFRSILSVINDVFSRFEIVEGDQLGFWYSRKNYESPHQGTLGGSCQAVGRLDWLEIYIKNPETVKLLILKSENTDDKIVGRSLLWYLDDGRILMDQIYTTKDSDYNVFKEYATAKGYITANWNETYIAHIKPIRFEKYPSIDTMRYWEPETGKISNRYFEGCEELYWSQEDDDLEEENYDDEYDE